MTDIINAFRGPYKFLSNFYMYPLYVPEDGRTYASVEHAYQAAKTHDPEWKNRIEHATSPVEAKRLGRFAPQRPDWDLVKIGVMRKYLRAKFFGTKTLGDMLLATDEAVLVEGNYWGDRFWGMEQVDGRWVGENHLGKLLMEVRRELRNRGGIFHNKA